MISHSLLSRTACARHCLTFEFSRARRPQAGVRRLERRVGRHNLFTRGEGAGKAVGAIVNVRGEERA